MRLKITCERDREYIKKKKKHKHEKCQHQNKTHYNNDILNAHYVTVQNI